MQAFRTSQARLAATIGAALALAAMAAWIPAQAQALDANGIGRTEVVRNEPAPPRPRAAWLP